MKVSYPCFLFLSFLLVFVRIIYRITIKVYICLNLLDESIKITNQHTNMDDIKDFTAQMAKDLVKEYQTLEILSHIKEHASRGSSVLNCAEILTDLTINNLKEKGFIVECNLAEVHKETGIFCSVRW